MKHKVATKRSYHISVVFAENILSTFILVCKDLDKLTDHHFMQLGTIF